MLVFFSCFLPPLELAMSEVGYINKVTMFRCRLFGPIRPPQTTIRSTISWPSENGQKPIPLEVDVL